MTTELIAFLVMVGVFLLGCFLCKLPVSLSMVLASVAGAIAGGQGLALRHLVEGMFAYVDTIMVIATAMIFMKVIQESGALDAIASLIIQRFHKVPALMLIFIMVIIMFPGMITGSSTASVLSAGSIMAPVLMIMGVPVLETACILALGGVLGMIAPPTNIPAMIIGSRYRHPLQRLRPASDHADFPPCVPVRADVRLQVRQKHELCRGRG
ncbi:MAG: TRAP transporter large permease subunit [Oscillospiraceae bacterium]